MPVLKAVTTPVALIVATAGVEELHAPPETPSVSALVAPPTQRAVAPLIAPAEGDAFTVIALEATAVPQLLVTA